MLVQRIGVGYSSPKIDVLLDAALAIGPLSLALDGLGAEYDLTAKTLAFTLHGAALAFSRPPLEISGALLRMGNDFAGEATLPRRISPSRRWECSATYKATRRCSFTPP